MIFFLEYTDSKFRNYLINNFDISLPVTKSEILWIFKEDVNFNLNKINYQPSLEIKNTQLTYETIFKTLKTNKFLNLPRLSSAQHFYELCPSWYSQSK